MRQEAQAAEPRSHVPRRPHHLWAGLLSILALIACGVALWLRLRGSALRAWQRYAASIGGELRARDRFAPACLTGTLRDRPFLMEAAISHDDDAPYYHTRAAMPVRNGAGFILGLRRKSLLEEAQTRGVKTPFDLEDADFERNFFLICNDSESLARVLTQEARRELARYHDVEIYARLEQIEWRRAGGQNDLRIIGRLNALLADMAEAIESLPTRPRALSQRLADEALIAKGV